MLKHSSMRLNKYISESGICSRRDADRFIEQGNVFINGKRAAIGDQVKAGDVVKVNGQLIEPREAEDLIFIALNKPVGIVSTTEKSERDNIVDFVRHSTRIFPVGRLDKDSQGLIFLNNNGDMVNKILRAGNEHEKEYLVSVNKPINDDFIQGMAGGVPILGTKTKKCKVSKEAQNVFRITLVQGLNRQIRRMCEYFGYEVVQLERVRIMNVSLKGLPVGEWRDLTDKELEVLFAAVENSSSEAPPQRKSGQRKSSANKHNKSQGNRGQGNKEQQGKRQHNKPASKSNKQGSAKNSGKSSGKGATKGTGKNTGKRAGPSKSSNKSSAAKGPSAARKTSKSGKANQAGPKNKARGKAKNRR